MKQDPHVRIINIISTIVIIVGIFVIACAYLVTPVRINPIVPDPTMLESPPLPAAWSFPFQKGNVTITLDINRSVYTGAKNADKRIFTPPGVPYEKWMGVSSRAMIQDPVQDELFDDLLRQFRHIRQERNLSDDEYAELLATYVQSFPYQTSDNPAKYPVETAYDTQGDCDDKSLLLAGLLSREGYKTSLLLFEKDRHMVVGIGSDDNRYLDTEYAYVDVMDYSFIGVPVNQIRGSKVAYKDPVVVPVGSGTKIYSSGAETSEIRDRALSAYNKSGMLSLQMRDLRNDSGGNISRYNQLSAEYYRYSRIYTYSIRHRFDRPGVYEYLKDKIPSFTPQTGIT